MNMKMNEAKQLKALSIADGTYMAKETNDEASSKAVEIYTNADKDLIYIFDDGSKLIFNYEKRSFQVIVTNDFSEIFKTKLK